MGTAVSPATTSFGGGSSAVVGEPLAAAVATTNAPPAQPVSANLQFAQPSGKPLSYTAKMANRSTPTQQTYASGTSGIIDKKRIQDLVKEVDPMEQLDEDVEEMLLQIADDFIDSVVSASVQFAKHRKSNTTEVKDVQLHLERNWNMWIPGFGSDELKPYKKAATTEAHKQRLALIKKTLKKY